MKSLRLNAVQRIWKAAGDPIRFLITISYLPQVTEKGGEEKKVGDVRTGVIVTLAKLDIEIWKLTNEISPCILGLSVITAVQHGKLSEYDCEL